MLMRTRSFWLFAATGFAELGALLAIGETSMSLKAVAVLCGLLVWLGRGSRVAWWLFVIANGFVLLMTLAIALVSSKGGSGGGGTLWGNVIVLSVGSVALLAVLLSRTMRRPQSLSV